ncbi:MAG TPA: UTP--glucose-1-phosphate uridylyltransferase, partial [Terriglobia bacterium]|nr:UTP--glucose-1-phosphate uridylyltransferase [Terriglobia bacterium]
MNSRLIAIVTSEDAAVRNQSLEAVCRGLNLQELLEECGQLELFWRGSQNLYERVRALFLVYAIHRFYLPVALGRGGRGLIPFEGYTHLLHRRFGEAIETFLAAQQASGPNDAISSALAAAYYALGFQTLAEQVRRSVKCAKGNQWMFRMGHPSDHPLIVRPELLKKSGNGIFPILRECTPVRMDLSHSGWSDIFFLAMDYPEGARVLNVSIDLGVRGRDLIPRPPIEAYFRIIDEPVLKLASVDLGATVVISNLKELFDFAKDYLGLLKAAVIASGLVPPGIEGSEESLVDVLARVVKPGHGIEIVSCVNNIPKGSRLAVSTSLLASLISVCMRATNQARHLTGLLSEQERRIVAARAILGEWLAGSGGGWQDSGGVWPGIKLIRGVLAGESDPENGISRGCLLPRHDILGESDAPPGVRTGLQDSLVLVHGGMAQNVGPILEMVTERYLLRLQSEWKARQEAISILDLILTHLREGDIRGIASATTRNFFGPIQKIIPWASNYYTETLIQRVRSEFGDNFWGFWMLGGMSGGGMGFIFDPASKDAAQTRLQDLMRGLKSELSGALPFAMEPVVYDFSINEHGTLAQVLDGEAALLPQGYYSLTVPTLV